MYVEGPAGADVYVDGIYAGVAPVSCAKPVGTHIVTVVQGGQPPKSYTVNNNDDGNDVTYSFSNISNEGFNLFNIYGQNN